ncbi:MAG: tRNA pseudouridine(13) synthase TruD [Helicobacter sp.]|nr:tRNA pseudouridine(13) synthase TruD [Helicobacter sp.]
MNKLFSFDQNASNFYVSEVALYEPNIDKTAPHILVRLQKVGLSTFEMLQILSEVTGVKVRDIGYAGLKDKKSTSEQFITLPSSINLESKIQILESKNITIKAIAPFQNKLKIGHLKGNNFKIILKIKDESRLKRAIESLQKCPIFPNYFGAQRFGKDGANFEEAKALLSGQKNIKSRKISSFLISSLQSYLFNNYLALRMEFNKILSLKDAKSAHIFLNEHNISIKESELDDVFLQESFFKILDGDLCMHYPFGRIFMYARSDLIRFLDFEIAPVGILPGHSIKKLSSGLVGDFFEFCKSDIKIPSPGGYRFIYAKIHDLDANFKNDVLELSFYLPRGCYATVVLEQIAKMG